MPNISYIAPTDFSNAVTGAMTADLPSGATGLQQYIDDACDLIDLYCQRRFDAQTGIAETLFSDGAGRVRIGPGGTVSVYPVLGFPITSVTSLTWQVRTNALVYATPSSTVQTIDSSNYLIEKDNDGDGYRVRVFVDFGNYRDRETVVQWTLTYDAGYSTTPNWLKRAAILVTLGLLRRRDGPQVVATDTSVRDLSNSSSEIKQAWAILDAKARRF